MTLFSQCATMSIVIVMTKHFATTTDEYKTKESKRSAVFYEKRILLFVLTLALACSCILPAYAAERSGNGYHIRDIWFNGKKYESSLVASYKAGQGAACTIIACQAYVRFTQKSVTASFDTKNYGYVSATGASHTRNFSSGNTSIESPYAVCSVGASQVISCRDISGGAVIYGDSNYQLYAHMVNR